jgi:DNA invertase Pin-like site-specific DNA recombinase
MRRPCRYIGQIALGTLELVRFDSLQVQLNVNIYGAIVYRLGHLVFIQTSGVRFPVALPSLCGIGCNGVSGCFDLLNEVFLRWFESNMLRQIFSSDNNRSKLFSLLFYGDNMISGQNVGYVRVSTAEQNPDRQLASLSICNIDKMFIDYASGKSMTRPELDKALQYIREGDTFIIWSIDRLSRSVKDLLYMVDTLTKRGITIKFIKENMTFSNAKSDPMSNLILGVLGAVSEFELALIRERQLEGISIAKEQGKYKGRKKSLNATQVLRAKEMVLNGMTKSKVAKTFEISRQTLYTYLDA